ncbi:heavy metal translocating P-type ATPase [uncultured Desulfobacter sp.]|uniref:heavy metal translocating P-type ATPase n=1 Tax=uncultured Desulfobacter sp. TaxID=240139 RepID=UPI0029F533E9|nr:heavy metal translocating P-type ATPase [uncultured Desulfobacter sp.]
MKYKLRQAAPFRTRIQFPGLRLKPACCAYVQERLESLARFDLVTVRPASGSIILVHPNGPPDLQEILGFILSFKSVLDEKILAEMSSGKTAKAATLHRSSDICNFSHVSGPTLLLSGLYIGWLMLKRVFAPVPAVGTLLSRLVSLPALLTVWLAIPIQRQALENFKKTGRVDMGFISTGLLYVSLFTGNIVTALAVAWLYNLSGWMESRIREHTRNAVKDMLMGRQTHAWKLVDGAEVRVDADTLVPGDTIVLGHGNTVPVDGRVIKGTVLINESAMTGEGMPVVKNKDQAVLAGTLVEDGSAWVLVEKTGDQTRMAGIIRLIESARTDLGDAGRASLKISQYMVPISLTLAGIAFFMTGSLFLAIATMMVTCPCALRLSASTAVSVAMGQAAAQGILIKGGTHVETAGRVNTLVLDKTGTLTRNAAQVSWVQNMDRRYKEETILKLTAAALGPLNHPLSRAVVLKAHVLGLELPACKNRKMVVGQGVKARVKTGTGVKTLLAGSRKFMAAQGLHPPDTKLQRGEGGKGTRSDSMVFVALENHILGCIHLTHTMRSDAGPDTMARLKHLGVARIVLLTGDTREGTLDLIEQFSFDEVRWGMSPEDKAHWIDRKRRATPGAVIAMVGDGINDTPAFSRSHLSFAVGDAGDDLTLECADIVLQKGGLGKVAQSLELGQHALSVIRESYTLAIGLNSVTLMLMLSGILSPFAGALIHNLITLGAVTNAARPPARQGDLPELSMAESVAGHEKKG